MTKSTKYQTIEEILEFAKSATKGDQIDSRTRKEFLDQANLKVIDTDPQVYHFLREVLQIKEIDLDRQNNKIGDNQGVNPTLQRRSLVAQSEEKISNFKNFFKDLNYPSSSPRDPDLSTQSKAR